MRACQILDTPPERVFDNIVHLAARFTGAPIAVVCLIDESRQWFKALVGLPVRETPREHSICAFTILEPEMMVIADATQDPRIQYNPLVVGPPGIRFYAGVPLELQDGVCVGTLAVADAQPRTISEADREALQSLARLVVLLLEQRRQGSEAAGANPITLPQLKALFRQFVEGLKHAPPAQAQRDFRNLQLHVLALASDFDINAGVSGKH